MSRCYHKRRVQRVSGSPSTRRLVLRWSSPTACSRSSSWPTSPSPSSTSSTLSASERTRSTSSRGLRTTAAVSVVAVMRRHEEEIPKTSQFIVVTAGFIIRFEVLKCWIWIIEINWSCQWQFYVSLKIFLLFKLIPTTTNTLRWYYFLCYWVTKLSLDKIDDACLDLEAISTQTEQFDSSIDWPHGWPRSRVQAPICIIIRI